MYFDGISILKCQTNSTNSLTCFVYLSLGINHSKGYMPKAGQNLNCNFQRSIFYTNGTPYSASTILGHVRSPHRVIIVSYDYIVAIFVSGSSNHYFLIKLHYYSAPLVYLKASGPPGNTISEDH